MSASHPFPYSSFKAYDIRGIVPTALNPEFAQELGRGLAARAHAAGVTALVVGRDGRLSSPALAQALQQGIRDGGINTIDVVGPDRKALPPVEHMRVTAAALALGLSACGKLGELERPGPTPTSGRDIDAGADPTRTIKTVDPRNRSQDPSAASQAQETLDSPPK